MNSPGRLKAQIAVVIVIAIVASVVLVLSPWSLSRGGSKIARSARVDSSDLAIREATSELETAPPTVRSESVAARAQMRVDRLQSPKPLRAAAVESVERLKKIRACEKTPSATCPIHSAMAKASPSGYADQLVDETIAELAFLKALANSEESEGRPPTFSVADVASAYIMHRDDNVREHALGLATLLVKTDPATAIDISSRALTSTISGPLASQALDLLQAAREANPTLVDKTLLKALNSGGWDVRDTVAEKLLPFLTPANRNRFAHVLAGAPVRSKLALRMKLNLEEFDRMDRL